MAERLTVFIAEEAPEVCEWLAALLAEVGGLQLIGQAHRLDQAMTSIQSAKPDVVILDVQMPGGDGIDGLRRLKQGKPAPAVIVFTPDSHFQHRKKCLEAGADFFFDEITEFNQRPQALRLLRRDFRM